MVVGGGGGGARLSLSLSLHLSTLIRRRINVLLTLEVHTVKREII